MKTKLNLHPSADYVRCDGIIESETSSGGIIIPQRHRAVLNQGIVQELGPDLPKDCLKVGSLVVFGIHSEYRIPNEDGTYTVFIRFQDIICGTAQDDFDLNRFKPEEKEIPPPSEKKRPLGRCTCYDPMLGENECPIHGN